MQFLYLWSCTVLAICHGTAVTRLTVNTTWHSVANAPAGSTGNVPKFQVRSLIRKPNGCAAYAPCKWSMHDMSIYVLWHYAQQDGKLIAQHSCFLVFPMNLLRNFYFVNFGSYMEKVIFCKAVFVEASRCKSWCKSDVSHHPTVYIHINYCFKSSAYYMQFFSEEIKHG